jgi:PAS domain S-box-containing protein
MPTNKTRAARAAFDAHLAAIVDSSTGAIISKSLDGTILSWNSAAEQLFGYSAGEMVGQSIRKIIPQDLQGEEDEILQRIRHGETVGTFETVRSHRSGHGVPVSLTVSPIRAPDGTIVGASKIVRDISVEVDRRKAARFAEERFRMLADNIDQLAWITDPTGYIEWYNKRWYEFTGTTLEEMRGWGWEKAHRPDHVDRVKQIWTNALAKGEDWEDTFPLRGADGEYRWFLSRAHPVRSEGGRIRYWFGTNTDITERREYESRIRLLLSESNHRAKNMLTIIQAMIHRIARDHPDLVEQLGRRITALGANQDLLIKRDWRAVSLGALVESQLSSVEDIRATRIVVSGLAMDVTAAAAEALGLALHELVANATKYGALSDQSGTVEVNWSVRDETGSEPRFSMAWIESNGPVVVKPQSDGFGTSLIKRNVELALGAHVSLDFSATGMKWTIDAPLCRVAKTEEE